MTIRKTAKTDLTTTDVVAQAGTDIAADVTTAATDVAADVTNAVAANIAAVTETVEATVAATKDQTEKWSQQVFAAYEDLTVYSKANVEALVQASNLLVKGVESISKSMIAFGQGQVEQSVATVKAVGTVKSIRELVDLQSAYVRGAYDALVAEATKTSELTTKVANEVIEPISARVTVTVEKLSKLKIAA